MYILLLNYTNKMEECQPDLINKTNAIQILSILANQHSSRRRRNGSRPLSIGFCQRKEGFLLLLKDAIMEYPLECKVRRLLQGIFDKCE